MLPLWLGGLRTKSEHEMDVDKFASRHSVCRLAGTPRKQ